MQINDPFTKQFLTLQNNFLTLQIIFQKIDRIQFALLFFLFLFSFMRNIYSTINQLLLEA